jgi:hypothetical protein
MAPQSFASVRHFAYPLEEKYNLTEEAKNHDQRLSQISGMMSVKGSELFSIRVGAYIKYSAPLN